jgi:hypothetical protein
VAYKLLIPAGTQIHNVFHISQLKKHIGPQAIPTPHLPLISSAGKILVAPVMVLETRAVPRHPNLVTQWLVQWLNLSLEEATWEDADFIKSTFFEYYTTTIKSWFPTQDPRGQGSSSGGGNCQDPEEEQNLHTLWEERQDMMEGWE